MAEVTITEEEANANLAATTASKEERPEGLPENFKTVEALAQSYKELQAERTTNPPSEVKPEATPKAKPNPLAIPEAPAAPQADQFTKFFEEHAKDGQLSDASFQELEGKGFSRPMVEMYMRGQQAQLADVMQVAHEAAGSKDNYQNMVEWAGVEGNLTTEQKDAFNKAADTADPGQLQLAVRGLYAQYSQANPTINRVEGGTGMSVGGNTFESMAQQLEAQGDKRYTEDPAFRDAVIQKIMRSKNY